MFLHLNPPRSFWQIPGTNLSLSRANSVLSLSDEELATLDTEQKGILNKSITFGIVSVVSAGAAAKKTSFTPVEQILSLPAQEIQRRHVSTLIKAKDTPTLNALLEGEKRMEIPRTAVIKLFEYAIDRIQTDFPDEDSIKEVKVIDEVIEEAKTAPPPSIQTKKKARNKPVVMEK